MPKVNPDQGSFFDNDSALGVKSVPIGLRAEGLSKVLGFYDSIGKTNKKDTHQRLGKVAAEVFAKTFGISELIESGFDEEAAQQMADDFYSGNNRSGYNPDQNSFLQSYIGKTNRPARRQLQQTLSTETGIYPTETVAAIADKPVYPQIRKPLNDDKVILPKHAEVVQAASYEGLKPEQKITLRRLISLAGEGIDEPWLHEEPSLESIKAGLYIPPSDPRYRRAELLVKVGVAPNLTHPHNVGVVFPPEEFRKVARSPRDLARHMQAATRRANMTNEDADDVSERTGRSAGHVLNDMIVAMSGLNTVLESDRDFLRKMYKELGSDWIAHYMSKNLERHRVKVDEMIHDMADVSAVNHNYGSNSLARLHSGIKKQLYGGNRTHVQIAEQWQTYMTLVGKYIGMRLVKIDVSTRLCQEELTAYQPYLDRKQEAA